MDYFQILSSGLYSDDPLQTLDEELEYFISNGLFAGFEEISTSGYGFMHLGLDLTLT